MPQIKPALALIALCLGGALALAGCGDQNSKAVFGSETGKHVAGWIAAHDQAAQASIESCVDCHGENLDGGISKIACSQCHLGSNFAVHPDQWGQLAYARHAGFVETNGSASCAVAACHGSDLLGASGPSCAVNCHMAFNPVTRQPQRHAWPESDAQDTTAENIEGHRTYFRANPVNFDSCRNNACHGGQGTDAVPPGVFLSGPGCLNVGCHGPGNPLPAEDP